MRWLIAIVLVLGLLATGPLVVALDRGLQLEADWRVANRDRTGLAPDPAAHPDAVVQIYAARAFRWRGIFAVHTWIATKAPRADHYRVYEVTGWGGGRVASGRGVPDRVWFGAQPEVVADVRGERAEAIIEAIVSAAGRYPHDGDYRAWPGPNSNTFVAWVLREVPDWGAKLPAIAIGKDYLSGAWIAPTPSGTGYQWSAGGLLGIGVARAEGLELNLLGLVLGVDVADRGIHLPGLGRVGPRRVGTGMMGSSRAAGSPASEPGAAPP